MIQHGVPNRNDPYTSKEDIMKLEAWKRKFEQEKDDVVTFGEYSRVESRKNDHFTGQLAQYDVLEEDLKLTDNRILIQNMTLMCRQQLNFRVWLYSTNEFYASDEDRIKVVDFIDFDLTLYGKRYKNTGLYILTITDLNLLYTDIDQTNKLHVAIENLSEAPKIAITSELIFQVLYESLETKGYHKV